MRATVTPSFRVATRDDLDAVLALIVDDGIGASREGCDQDSEVRYEAAWRAIESDPNQWPLLARVDGQTVGYLQLTFIPGLSRGGAWRGLLESVRVGSAWRGRGVGTSLVEHAMERCRQHGCTLVQLTTDTRRVQARRFYETLGFEASHHGMKKAL